MFDNKVKVWKQHLDKGFQKAIDATKNNKIIHKDSEQDELILSGEFIKCPECKGKRLKENNICVKCYNVGLISKKVKENNKK